MIQKFRERLILILIILLPFHAFGVTVFTKIIRGNNHAPLPLIAFWKEAIILVVLSIIFLELLFSFRKIKLEGSSHLASLKSITNLDILDKLIITFFALAFLVTLFSESSLRAFVFGAKYDLFPLLIFLMLRRVAWSSSFFPRVLKSIVAVGLIVAIYGIVSFFFPMGFFRFLGFSDLHSVYSPNSSLAAFQQIESMGLRRIQSTFSGPNQFGLWLLLPWSAGVFGLTKVWMDRESFFVRLFSPSRTHNTILVFSIFFVLTTGTALLLTFSRSAWLAAFILLIFIIIFQYDGERERRILVRSSGLFIITFVALALLFPAVVLRADSTKDHILKPLKGVQSIINNPFGLGLGAAGPASNRVSDACVFLEKGANTSWAVDRPELCVFAGDIQMQPLGRVCSCPFVVENWYLQIGVELGIIGLILFLSIIITLLIKLKRQKGTGVFMVFCAFLGVCLAGMLLHSFEDAAVAYTVWILAGVGLGAKKKEVTVADLLME
ncbi:MAG: hypothetical protein KAS32_28255 [Candidatus Peribacteraceae bacterium]|nr:hypothetical protein [Candidatus Peribacteraceae bacterium]